MWTRVVLLLVVLVVVMPLALLLGYHVGTGWVQQLLP